MLRELQLDGTVYDKVETAIERYKAFEEQAIKISHGRGYCVSVSGGKDSDIIASIAIKSGVKCFFHHNLTTVDAPETVLYIKEMKKRIEARGYEFEISYARNPDGSKMTMWTAIEKQGLPSRQRRWCCDFFKERYGRDLFIVTGVRWAESNKRKNTRGLVERWGKRKRTRVILNNDNETSRKKIEACLQAHKFILNPIIDWTNEEVWQYIDEEGIKVNPLYSQGFKRIGCIGCPLSDEAPREFALYPRIEAAYRRAAYKYFKENSEKYDLVARFGTPEKYFENWKYQCWFDNKNALNISDTPV